MTTQLSASVCSVYGLGTICPLAHLCGEVAALPSCVVPLLLVGLLCAAQDLPPEEEQRSPRPRSKWSGPHQQSFRGWPSAEVGFLRAGGSGQRSRGNDAVVDLSKEPFLSSAETGQRPGGHPDEMHPPLHPLHQAQRNQKASRLGGEQVSPKRPR